MGKRDEARTQFDLILSGKTLEALESGWEPFGVVEALVDAFFSLKPLVFDISLLYPCVAASEPCSSSSAFAVAISKRNSERTSPYR